MSSDEDSQPLHRLPFPPITISHILNCSFHSWYPKYVLLSSHLLSNVSILLSVTPKARLIQLSETFLEYLRSVGIVLQIEELTTTNDISIINSDRSDDGKR